MIESWSNAFGCAPSASASWATAAGPTSNRLVAISVILTGYTSFTTNPAIRGVNLRRHRLRCNRTTLVAVVSKACTGGGFILRVQRTRGTPFRGCASQLVIQRQHRQRAYLESLPGAARRLRVITDRPNCACIGQVMVVFLDCVSFRRNIARTLDAVSTARYERTLAPSSSRENSSANRLRTSASGAPVRSRNELIARSCLRASLLRSKSELTEIPP